MPWHLLLAIAVALAVSALACGLLRRIATAGGFLDRPGSEAHKQQAVAVPYGGGLGMAVGMAAGLAAAWLAGGDASRGHLVPVGLGAVGLLLLGLADDRKALGPWTKLIAQLVVCAAVVQAADLPVDVLRTADWLGPFGPTLGFVAAWGWLVLCSNAFNLLDHADGLSASVASVSCIVLLSAALIAGDAGLSAWWLALLGALAGFLCWNAPPARIYMGDAGALPLGYLVGTGTLLTTFWDEQAGGSPLALLGPLLILAIPLFDTGAVIVKRLRRGTPIMRGDRNHISHRLKRLGVGPRATLAAVVALQAALAGSALLLRQGDALVAGIVVCQAAGILVAVAVLETARDHG